VITDRDVSIPMRDGTVLRGDVYRPQADAPVPVVVGRTVYDKRRSPTPPAVLDPERAVAAGLALVCQDVRGQHASDGDFYPFRTDGPDGYDTVEWAAIQGWCDGRVVMAGRSYSGGAQWLAAAEGPPHLRAIAPMVNGSDGYHGWVYQGGAFQLGFNLFWAQMMAGGRGKLDAAFRHLPLTEVPLLDENPAASFYRDWLSHPTRDDYWEPIAINSCYGRVQVPALCVGGWYDLFLGGTLENFAGLRARGGSAAARRGTRLIVGPWAHGSTFGAYPDHSFEEFGPEAAVDLAAAQLEFFWHHLRQPAETAGEPAVRIFVMGENRWRDEAEWPLARAQDVRWFIHSTGDAALAGGSLSSEAPADEPPDSYVYDPNDPAPTLGGPTSLPAGFMQTNSGPLDQRPVEERQDVLVYSSEPLAEPLEVIGHLRVVLHAATTAADTDFVAKLSDVDHEGKSRILAEGVLRARFREGFDQARPVEPGAPLLYEIDLVATANVFLPGHRIRLAITSSSFPRFDRNTNTGHELGTDGPEDLLSARQTVFHDADRASHVVLPVISA